MLSVCTKGGGTAQGEGIKKNRTVELLCGVYDDIIVKGEGRRRASTVLTKGASEKATVKLLDEAGMALNH